MLVKKNRFLPMIVTFILLSILISSSGCNLLISLVAPNNPPVAIVCNDQQVYIREEVDLDGSNSYDPDGDALTFEWSITASPEDVRIENSDIVNRTSSIASVIFYSIGTYEFKLTVSDSEYESSVSLTIIVDELAPDPDPTPLPDSTPNSTTPPEVTNNFTR
jgi:hypothetical protein